MAMVEKLKEKEIFCQQIYDMVEEYLGNEEAYSDDAQLEINTENLSLSITDSDQEMMYCDYYPIMDFVRVSENDPGLWEPDRVAIEDVAADYTTAD